MYEVLPQRAEYMTITRADLPAGRVIASSSQQASSNGARSSCTSLHMTGAETPAYSWRRMFPKFARDSPLEGRVTSELVSEIPQIPC